MDVRCERCRAQYTLEDDQLTPAGVSVSCTVCGHTFLARRPPPAAPPRRLPADPVHTWAIRQASGQALAFSELNVLQRWIVERKVVGEDEVTSGDGAWVQLGTLPELKPFFDVVAAADRALDRTTSRYPSAPFPTPTWATLQPGASAATPPGPSATRRPGPDPTPAYVLPPLKPRPSGADHPDLDEADLRAVGRSSHARNVLLIVLLLLVAGAAAAYVFRPSLLGLPAAAPPAAPAPPAKPPEPPPAPPAAPLPQPEPEVKAEAKPADPEPPSAPPAAEPVPEVKPEPKPEARPRPPSLRQLLAEARRLREAGKAEQALDRYGRIIQEEPGNAEALAGRGLCYLDLDQYAPAEASLQAALRLSPTQPDALLGLAEACRAQGRTAEAIALYERYLAAHPQGDEAAVARNAINQLKE